MDEPLPEEFDIIIIGTGLPESVLSGAFSRINQKVLHLDSNDYYGSVWASFNINAFDDLMNYKEIPSSDGNDFKKALNSDEILLPINQRSCITDRESGCHLSKIAPVEVKTPSNVDGDSSKEEESETCSTKNAVCSEETTVASKNNAKSQFVEDEDIPPAEEDSKDVSLPFISESELMQNKDVQESIAHPQNEQSKSSEISLVQESCQKPKPSSLSPHEMFYNQWRHFNIDLTSKILYSRGLLVELLIQSNVSRYLEFRNVSQLITLMNGKLHHVPCTRADVFKSKLVSVVQKRIMMRVLTTCANHEQHPEIERDFKEKKFVEFLDANKLCKEAQHFIIHSISMVNDDASTMEGVRATKKFLQSLGRYGNCAFLYPLYGVGEIPQAFSRLSAVFGGLFCLRRFAFGLVVDQETGQCKGIIDSTGQKISCRYVIVDETNVPDVAQTQFKNYASRAIYVADSPVMPSSDGSSTSKTKNDHVSVISVPATEDNCSIRLVEAGPSASVCPRKHWLIHAATKSISSSPNVQSPKKAFANIEKVLFFEKEDHLKDEQAPSSGAASGDTEAAENSKPNLLWHAYFNVRQQGVDSSKLPQNVFVLNGPDEDLGFDAAMIEARRVFEVICPEEEFLPRAPEPDEIVFNDEGYNTEKSGSSSEAPEEHHGDYEEREDELHDDAATADEEDLSAVQDNALNEATDAPTIEEHQS